jgi:hypothetical protein
MPVSGKLRGVHWHVSSSRPLSLIVWSCRCRMHHSVGCKSRLQLLLVWIRGICDEASRFKAVMA